MAGEGFQAVGPFGEIDLKLEKAVDHLNGLEWYLYGGSYFDGIVGRRSGPMRWGP